MGPTLGQIAFIRIAINVKYALAHRGSMRSFQHLKYARAVCEGHGFMRNQRDGLYGLGEPTGGPRIPQASRLVRAWDNLTRIRAAA